MHEFLTAYWPHLTGILALAMGIAGGVHAVMTKSDVRAAAAWTGVIVLSPILGAVVYAIFGINRIRRETRLRGRRTLTDASSGADRAGRPAEAATLLPEAFHGMVRLGDTVAAFPLTTGNRIDPIRTGADCYAAMEAAIDAAGAWILLETYIFDADRVGRRIAERLAAAVARGVEVRVLVDAIGSHYSTPSIATVLARAGVPHALFMDGPIGFRLPYANLRTHRKLLVVDGRTAFLGGMNIREQFSAEFAGEAAARDAHFRIEGPVVPDLGRVFAEDWLFTTGETLPLGRIFPAEPARPGSTIARAVPSGPDHNVECNHDMLMGILSVARRHILVASPYFLPDRRLIAAFKTAAERGVAIDIVVPGVSNLALVDCAMTAQFDQLVAAGCRIWRSAGPFDHAKLMTADGLWCYVGSSNLDPRSLRLNFEIDLEVYDAELARWIETRIRERVAGAAPVTPESLASRRFLWRLRDRTIWLASPYL